MHKEEKEKRRELQRYNQELQQNLKQLLKKFNSQPFDNQELIEEIYRAFGTLKEDMLFSSVIF